MKNNCIVQVVLNDHIIFNRKTANIDVFEWAFEKAILTAYKQNGTLTLNDYAPLSGNLKLLTKLQQSNVDFIVENFKDLNKTHLPTIIEHIAYKRSIFGSKTKIRLAERRKAGLDIGNPDIAKYAKDQAVKTRIRVAIFNELNLTAGQEIFRLKKLKYNFNAISQKLNQSNYQTSRGGAFYAKSIARIHNRYFDLKSNFNMRSDKNNYFDTLIPIRENYEYGDLFALPLTNASKTTVNIYDWRTGSPPILSFDASDTCIADQKLSFVFSKVREFMPGQHYIELERNKKIIARRGFTFAQSIHNMIAP